MSDEIRLITTTSLGESFAEAIEAEFSETFKNQHVPIRQMSLLLASEVTVSDILTISIVSATVAGTISNVLGTFALRLIDFVVRECRNSKRADLPKIDIRIVYEASGKRLDEHIGFILPSDADNAKAFFSELRTTSSECDE